MAPILSTGMVAGAAELAPIGIAKAIGKAGPLLAARQLPRQVREEWAKRTVDELANGRDASQIYGSSLYPKVEAATPAKEVLSGLNNSWKQTGSKQVPTGIRAATRKLVGPGGVPEDLSLAQLRIARSEIGPYLTKKASLPPDEFSAYTKAYSFLTDRMRSGYQTAGKLGEFTKAEQYWASHQDTFFNPRSPIAKAISARTKTGDIDSPKVVAALSKSDVAKGQLERLAKTGIEIETRLPKEAQKMQQALRWWEAEPSLFSLKLPLLKNVIGYGLSRPARFPTLLRKPLPEITERMAEETTAGYPMTGRVAPFVERGGGKLEYGTTGIRGGLDHFLMGKGIPPGTVGQLTDEMKANLYLEFLKRGRGQ